MDNKSHTKGNNSCKSQLLIKIIYKIFDMASSKSILWHLKANWRKVRKWDMYTYMKFFLGRLTMMKDELHLQLQLFNQDILIRRKSLSTILIL